MKVRSTLAAFGLIGAAAFSEAALVPTVSLDLSDSNIMVGESFTVDVRLTDVDASLGSLVGFGFYVDPFASLAHVDYLGASIGADFFDFSADPGEVAGLLADPLGTTGSEIHLATLSFLATDVGFDTLWLEGELDGFHGLVFEFGEFAFEAQTQLQVVPEPSTYGLAGAGLLLGAALLRRRHRARAAAALAA